MTKTLIIALTMVFTNIAFAQESKFQLSSHILDITKGQPAAGVKVVLSKLNEKNEWLKVDEKTTDSNGRIKDFLKKDKNAKNKGTYKLTFYTKPYFDGFNLSSFYPYIEVVFQITDETHYHVPITVSPYGYSTYRGS